MSELERLRAEHIRLTELVSEQLGVITASEAAMNLAKKAINRQTEVLKGQRCVIACQQVAIGAMAYMLHDLFEIPMADLVELTDLTEFEIRSHARTIKTELAKEFPHAD